MPSIVPTVILLIFLAYASYLNYNKAKESYLKEKKNILAQKNEIGEKASSNSKQENFLSM